MNIRAQLIQATRDIQDVLRTFKYRMGHRHILTRSDEEILASLCIYQRVVDDETCNKCGGCSKLAERLLEMSKGLHRKTREERRRDYDRLRD